MRPKFQVTHFNPFVLWHSENLKAFKHINKNILPVYRSNKKLWTTQLILQDVLLNCYDSEVEKYCLENNISFQILIIVDNSSVHPFIDDLHPNIKVLFLLPNAISLIHPMGQGF